MNFFKKIKEQLFLFFIILLSIIVIISMLFLNDMVYNIRLLELKSFLKDINRMNSNVDYLFLVAKYKLHKELYENKIKYLDFNKEELKVSVLLSNFQKQNELILEKYNKTSLPVFYILNFLRFFLNKQHNCQRNSEHKQNSCNSGANRFPVMIAVKKFDFFFPLAVNRF